MCSAEHPILVYMFALYSMASGSTVSWVVWYIFFTVIHVAKPNTSMILFVCEQGSTNKICNIPVCHMYASSGWFNCETKKSIFCFIYVNEKVKM